MKLSLMSFSFQFERFRSGLNAEKLCKLAKDNNIEYLDLMVSEVLLYGIKNLKSAFEKSGIKCDCLIAHLPFFKGVDKYPDKLMQAINLCKELDVHNLMIIPGSMDDKECEKLRREEMIARTIELFKMAVNRAKEDNITILFEDTPQSHKPLSSAKDCLEVLSNVEGLGFVFDTANFMISEEDFDIIKDYELLKDYIKRIHLKDVVKGHLNQGERCENGEVIRCVTTGSGIVDLQSFINRLKEDKYDGFLCIEYTSFGDVSGLDHSKYINIYVQNILGMINGNLVRPKYVNIEGLDKPVSRIFFGTAIRSMTIGKKAFALLDAVYAMGINAFDCARGYGFAEKSLGSWINERNNREKVIVLSKCGNVNMKGEVKINREVILKELNQSLKALNLDYIDIYLLHRDDPKTPINEIMDTLNEIKRQGKIKIFGVSNWSVERIKEANEYAKEKGIDSFSVSSPYYGLADQIEDPWGGNCISLTGDNHQEDRIWYEKNQMPILAYSSLGRGFFSGKFKAFDYENAKKVLDNVSQKGYLYEKNMRRLAKAEELAFKYQTSVTDIALRYVYSNKMNIFAIMSTENPSRLVGNIKAANNPLTKEECEYLES